MKRLTLLAGTLLAAIALASGGNQTNVAPASANATRATYLLKVQTAYQEAWQGPVRPSGIKRATQVSVVVAKNGRVISSKIRVKSGDKEVDESVQKVLDTVKSVPPFEVGAKEPRRTVTVNFKLND